MAQFSPGQGPRGFLTAGRQYGMGPVIESAVANQIVATSAAAQSVIRQQLTPLIGSVAFDTPASGIVQAFQTRTAFIDSNGANQNSGVTQSNATQTFSRGITKSGTRSFLLGLGVQVYSNEGSNVTAAAAAPAALDPGEVMMAIHQTSLKLNIGSAEQQLGKVACWPAGSGTFGIQGAAVPSATNGAPSLDSLSYFSDVVVLDPFINFSVDVTIEGPIDLTILTGGALVQAILGYSLWFPRIIDFSAQQKAGA